MRLREREKEIEMKNVRAPMKLDDLDYAVGPGGSNEPVLHIRGVIAVGIFLFTPGEAH